MPDCRQIIMSQDYGDFIVEYGGGSEKALERFGNDCLQIINERYYCAYEKLTNIPNFGVAATLIMPFLNYTVLWTQHLWQRQVQ